MAISPEFQNLLTYMNTFIIGQEDLTKKLLITLLCNGHLLVEGVPGLAKTKAVKTLSSLIDAQEQRIQFTPDLLPSDITGSDVYRHETHQFYFQKGPIFSNIILADEINRAPAKVQSALLEAMGERQITVGNTTYKLPDLFMVMATQNPIEQEGTYTLPEAQLDRFLMYVKIKYPTAEAERQILKLVRKEEKQEPLPEFKKGDFYCIEKNTVYAQKSKKGTRILFIKVPSINDNDTSMSHISKIINDYSNIFRWELLPFSKLGFHKYDELGIENRCKSLPDLDMTAFNKLKEKYEFEKRKKL